MQINKLKEYIGNFKLDLRIIDFEMLQYFRGNRQAFGLMTAIKSMSPILQLFTNWKYRHSSLIIPQDSDVKINYGDKND